MKRVSASRHPNATLHKHLKLPTDGAGDVESCKSDTRLYLYIIKREFVCVTNEQFISIKLLGIDNVNFLFMLFLEIRAIKSD